MMRRRFVRLAPLAMLCAAMLHAPPSRGASLLDPFLDPRDGQLDVSDWLLNKRGFRCLIARLLGVHMGMDFAGSEGEFAFYFQVGTGW